MNNNGDWPEWSQHVLIEIKRLGEKQEKMSDILVENTKQLEIHIEGVKLARQQNEILRQDFEVKFDKLADDIKPIEAHVLFVKNTLKFISWVLGIAATLAGLANLVRS